MKKILLACSAAFMLVASSCGGSKSSASADNAAFGDSLATVLGQMQAAQFVQMYNSMTPEEQAKFSKDAMLKGFKEMLKSDTTEEAYMNGLYGGFMALQQVMQIERQSNIKIDINKLYDAFAETLKKDSVDVASMQAQAQVIGMELQNKITAYQTEQVMNSDKTKKTIADGKAFVEKAKKADSSIQTTKSGLSYKVVKEGTGEKIKSTDKVKAIVKGKLTNDTIFQPEGELELMVSSTVPGFQEGLELMQKGAKYILYVPGDLGYGTKGVPGKIDPMETLIFEIEVVDVTDGSAASQAPQVKVIDPKAK